MPVYVDHSAEKTMTEANAAESAHDTSLQVASASHATFAHSVGLVRDWLRDYESTEDQAALDILWPHWLDTPDARGEAFSTPPNEALHASCSMPLLLRCYEDSDWSSSDESLRCKRSLDDPYGICVHVNTCFQYSHCVDGTLCSGTGFCEQPQIVVHNTLATLIELRISSKKARHCTGRVTVRVYTSKSRILRATTASVA